MAVEEDAEKLAKSQVEKASRFFGIEIPQIPQPGDWLFEVVAKNEKEKLFDVNKLKPFFLPGRQLAEDVNFPGLKHPLAPWIYIRMRLGIVDKDVDWLPEGWILLDTTERPNYNNGQQMYPDTPRYKEMLATLREQGQIKVLDFYKDVNKDSRFAISADEIDGSEAVVSKAVADILKLDPDKITTPPYSTFVYIGNLDHPELGQVNTAEWLRNECGYGIRLCGGHSGFDGLSNISVARSDNRGGHFGFRLQVSSPSKT